MAIKHVEILTQEMKDEQMKSFHDAGDIWRAAEEEAIKFYFNKTSTAGQRLGGMLRGTHNIILKALYIDNLYRKVNMKHPKEFKIYDMATDANHVLAGNAKSFLTVKMFNKSPYQAIIVNNEIQKVLDFIYANYDYPDVTCGFFVDPSRMIHLPYMYAHAYGMAIEIKLNDSIPHARGLYRAYTKEGIKLYMLWRGKYLTIMRGMERNPKGKYKRWFNGYRRFTTYSVTEAYLKEYTWSKHAAVF